jgi:hypothetical protein
LFANLPTIVSQPADNCLPTCRQLFANLPTIVCQPAVNCLTTCRQLFDNVLSIVSIALFPSADK